MGTGNDPSVGEVLPIEAWNILKTKQNARLVDVRTQAEWTFVGVPDVSELNHTLICIEWSSFPDMSKNPRFAEAVTEALGNEVPSDLLFLCRSGVRSLHAARLVGAHYASQGHTVDCLNVTNGFEGDKDAMGHRGSLSGWKKSGLAWSQS